MIAVDCEAGGLDLFLGTRPFFITSANLNNEVTFWGNNWRVDPLTRKVIPVKDELIEVADTITNAERVVGHNSKYDSHAIRLLMEDYKIKFKWPWDRAEDTLVASHLLASAKPYNLTDLAMDYLAMDIQPLEDKLEVAVKKARSIIQHAQLKVKRGKATNKEIDIARWMIAKEDCEETPSAKSQAWRADYWLPRTMVMEGIIEDSDYPNWLTVLEDYANADPQVTLWLWAGYEGRYEGMEAEIKREGWWELYREKMKLPSCFEKIERRGVSVILSNADELKDSYLNRIEECDRQCAVLTDGRMSELPKGITNELRDVIANHFHLKSPKTTKKGAASYDKYVLEEWEHTLDPDTQAHQFIQNLQIARRRYTALGYRETYEKFWIPFSEGFARLHMSLNQTGTRTTRISCSNPNGQQISAQELEDDEGVKHSARYMFGPAPGREWWSFDFTNLELYIPGYHCNEEALIELFEKPDEPPYYGQYHLLTFSAVFTEMWNKGLKESGEEGVGEYVKTEFKQWYKQNKIGNFCKQYRGGKRKVDASFRRQGAYDLLAAKFPCIEDFNTDLTHQATRTGRVFTLHGYPLMTKVYENGELVPTTPLSYVVQGTAGECCNRAVVRFDEKLSEWRRKKFDAHMILPVHDEIVVDLPARGKLNLPRINELKTIMEMSGQHDLGIPLRVGVAYHPRNWGEKEKIDA